MKKTDKYHQQNSFALMNESLSLFKAGGVTSALLYYVGTLPFLLALLYFWSDMARSSFAENLMVIESLVMVIAFVWMKGWQSLFCQRLYRLRAGLPPEKQLSALNLATIFINQATIQPWGLILIPLSLLFVVPFARTYAFFQSCSVLDAGGSAYECLTKSSEQSQLWPLQNHLIIWILSPWLLAMTLLLCFGSAAILVKLMAGAPQLVFLGQGDLPWLLIGVLIMVMGVWPACPLAFTVAINVGLVCWLVPYLINSLFGIETMAVQGGVYSIANSTTLLTIYAVTHLALDPINKTAYVLSCFYGNSAKSGADLLAELKLLTAGILLVFVVLLGGNSYALADQTISPQPLPQSVVQLESAINRTLQKAEYAWRLPRITRERTLHSSYFNDFFSFFKPMTDGIMKGVRWVGEILGKIFQWIEGFLPGKVKEKPSAHGDWTATVQPAVIFLAALAAILGVWQFLNLLKNRGSLPVMTTQTVQVIPDLTSADLTADQLPEKQWLHLAGQMLSENNLRLALRAIYLAGLASLEGGQIIQIKPFKSNREYGLEVSRFSHNYPELPGIFQHHIELFEKVWYGDYPVDRQELQVFAENQKQLRI